MPYKNPEHKRQWERQHREQRNAQRRMRRVEWKAGSVSAHPVPDPASVQKPISAWAVVKGIGGFALAVGIAVLAALGGPSGSGYGAPSTGSKP